MAGSDKCECEAPRNERCVDCGYDLHSPGAEDCDNQHHEFKAAARTEKQGGVS